MTYRIIALESWEIEKNRYALDGNDRCYYYMTYDPWSDLLVNEQKKIVKNLKIKPNELIGNPLRKKYKDQSIQTVSNWIIETINEYQELKNYLWIPASPSKSRDDQNYDDRLVKILELVKAAIPDFAYFDALYAKNSLEESRRSNERDIQKKLENLGIDKNFINYLKTNKIVIFDDVLTTGSTFKATQNKIHEIDNTLKIIGVFLAKSLASFQS